MALLININGKEVKNPIARFFITLVGIIISLTVLLLFFFLILPVVWFAVIAMIFLVLAILIAAPKFIRKYHVIVIEKNKLEQYK